MALVLAVQPSHGLSAADAERRLRLDGPNVVGEAPRVRALAIVLNQLKSIVVALMLAAACLSYAFADWIEGTTVLGVVVLNTLIGFATELRAVRSMEALRRLGTAKCRVRRDGGGCMVPAPRLVVGDVVLLEAGDVVSADLRLVEAANLATDESALTGESVPVGKQIAPLSGDTPLAERTNMAYRGTIVVRGSAMGIVVATGSATAAGRIARLVEGIVDQETPLERRLEGLARKLAWIALAVAAVASLLGVISGRDVVLMVETGIALAVASVPEGLPVVATVALARGLLRMAHRSALVKGLAAVETLGATGIVVTDKTGTLTENCLEVVAVRTALGDATADGLARLDGTQRELVGRLLTAATLCSNASLSIAVEDMGVGDPLEVALLRGARRMGITRKEALKVLPEIREEPFDPGTKMMATFHRSGDRIQGFLKGAPESIASVCRRVAAGAESRAMTEFERNRWLQAARALATDGLRVLAIAERPVSDPSTAPYQDATWLGLVGMRDPARSGTAMTVRACQRAGVRFVMATGDELETALAIAHDVDLLVPGAMPVMTGRELSIALQNGAPSPAALSSVQIFARVDPEQKLDIIALHQQRGAVVAMIGDGVNDAPALRKAEIGIAMGKRGTDVARQAADMVLKDDSLASIWTAIGQGRVIFDNIRSFVLYLLSCNAAEILVVAVASLWDGPMVILPLQILFLNLVTDIFPALALGFGEGSGTVMRRRPRDPREPFLTSRHWLAIVGWALLLGAVVLAAAQVAVHVLGYDHEAATGVSFLSLAFAQLLHVFNMREPNEPAICNAVTRNPWVWMALGLCAALLFASVRLPEFAVLLAVPEPDARGWVVVAVASLLPLVIGQLGLVAAATVRRRPVPVP